jgi:hypothetical protein
MGMIGHGVVVMFGRLFRVPALYGNIACSQEHFGGFCWSGLCPVSSLLATMSTTSSQVLYGFMRRTTDSQFDNCTVDNECICTLFRVLNQVLYSSTRTPQLLAVVLYTSCLEYNY